MAKIESAFYDIGSLDILAKQDTIIHRIDPRVKLITTLFFTIIVVSFDKYEVSAMVPFIVYPFFLAALGNIPFGYMFKKIAIVAPFIFCIGIFNPIFDTEVMIAIGSVQISGGWLSFGSIMLRVFLTISAALALIATSGFRELCLALEKLCSPKAFALQLLFLYRYIFVLIEEGTRLIKARKLRSFNGRGQGISATGNLIGHLLIRSLNRANRIHLAMLCRGFDGEIRLLKQFHIKPFDIVFVCGWSVLFIALRFINFSEFLGNSLVLIGK